jgi:non-specific serine/threonine protein kinase
MLAAMDATGAFDSDKPTQPPASRVPSDPAPPTAIGSYSVLGELGRGGMGVVLLARDHRLERDVAIKLLPGDLDRNPVARDRFLAEGRALAALNHPNIAIVHSLEESAGRHFLTMERIEGRSLRERLRGGPLSLDETLAIARQISRAIEAAHAKGVVHRDLKPSNVMLRDDGTVKVLDFGLAVRLDRVTGGPTSAREIAGTPGYMSPEQVRGEPADARTDVWALGVMVHECLAGRPMVEGVSATEIRANTLTLDVPALLAEPRPCGPLPSRVSRLLAGCLAGPASDRIATMREARLLLEEEIAERSLPGGAGAWMAPAASRVGNVPRRLTRFVGRHREIEAAARLLAESRLLTITGTGGCGKSRTSLELAERLHALAPDGAWLVELASLADPALLASTVHSVLGAPHDARGDATGALTAFLDEKRVLLILDNCEHLLDACADLVARVLAACPHVRVLATSREALRVPGERTFVLQPLGLPPASGGPRLESAVAAEECDAVQFFVDRARAVQPSFALDAGNRPAVSEICRRLDGIPLAIELAAARMKVLSVQQILDLLDHRFKLLIRGTRTAQAHQRTLRTLIDWSYDRLEAGEQAVLRRLSVFRGAWTLEAVEAVATGGEVASWDALDLFTRLVEKSLVAPDLAEGASGTARYSLLESIREYAHEKLLEHPDEAQEAARRHRDYIVTLAVEGFDGLKGAAQAQWTVRLDDAVNDVRAVLAGLAADPQGADSELRVVGAYGLHWMKRGMWAEGREALQRALARRDADHTSAPYGQALTALGNIEYRTGELDVAREHYQAAVGVLQTAGTPLQLANVTMNLGNVAWTQGDLGGAQQWYEGSLAHFRDAGSSGGAAGCLSNLSAVAISREEFDRVESLQSEALAIFEPQGMTDNICLSLFQLGIAACARQEYDLSRRRFARALVLAREADNRWNILVALDNLTGLENRCDRPEAARESLVECLVRLRDMRDPVLGVSALENSAWLLRGLHPGPAVTLLAAATAERARHQMPRLSYERVLLDRLAAELDTGLGAERYADLSADGATLTLAEALARAETLLGVPEATSSSSGADRSTRSI